MRFNSSGQAAVLGRNPVRSFARSHGRVAGRCGAKYNAIRRSDLPSRFFGGRRIDRKGPRASAVQSLPSTTLSLSVASFSSLGLCAERWVLCGRFVGRAKNACRYCSPEAESRFSFRVATAPPWGRAPANTWYTHNSRCMRSKMDAIAQNAGRGKCFSSRELESAEAARREAKGLDSRKSIDNDLQCRKEHWRSFAKKAAIPILLPATSIFARPPRQINLKDRNS